MNALAHLAPDVLDLMGDLGGPASSDAFDAGGREAARFLIEIVAATNWRPDWWLNLCAIYPNPGTGALRGRSWRVSDLAAREGEIAAWLAAQNRDGLGCYFSPDPLLREVSSKAKAADVAAVVMLAADIDPDTAAGGFDAANAAVWRMAEDVAAGDVVLAWVANTGHGAALYAPLAEPVEVAAGVAARTAWQARLRDQAPPGADVDHTHDAGRLMRLPGLLNRPRATKVDRGYPPEGRWASVRTRSPGAVVSPEAFAALAAEGPAPRERASPVPQERHRAPSADRFVALMRDMPNPEKLDRLQWVAAMRAARAAATGVCEDDGREAVREWCERWQGQKGHDDAEFERTWPTVAGPSQVGWRELVQRADGLGSEIGRQEAQHIALDESMRDFSAIVPPVNAEAPGIGHNGGPPLGDDARAPVALSEDAVAADFSRRHGEDWAFVATWGTWFGWDGTKWARDDTLRARDLVREVCRSAATRADTAAKGARLSSANTMSAVERIAQTDRRHARTVDGWDADPWRLNTPGGVVDLRTGAVIPHSRDFYMTKATATAPAAEPACPTWLRFLDEATGGDAGTVDFLRRWCGYCLTGATKEHALLFVYGLGGNGKSVFTSTFTGLLGDYAIVAGMETFTAARGERHSTELARLQGARLVMASETEEGRAFAEARIKALTGGEPITARFMRQDDFTYTPQFKLIFTGNHKPVLRNVDDAARRRFNLLPFTRRPAHPDTGLPEKLRAEWSGILRWAITGCVDWQRDGLRRPAAVAEATAEYFASEDAIGRWIEECCMTAPEHREKTATLFDSFTAWAGRNREYVGSVKWFAGKMADKEFEQWRDAQGRGFRGIQLLSDDKRTSAASLF